MQFETILTHVTHSLAQCLASYAFVLYIYIYRANKSVFLFVGHLPTKQCAQRNECGRIIYAIQFTNGWHSKNMNICERVRNVTYELTRYDGN